MKASERDWIGYFETLLEHHGINASSLDDQQWCMKISHLVRIRKEEAQANK